MKIKNKETSIYDVVSEYDFLLIPTANAVAGAVGFGLPGCLVGIAAGVIDEALVRLGYTNGRYLSPIIQGVSSFATLTTSWVIIGAGGVLNLAFSQLIISEYSEYADKITPTVHTALQGGYVFGWKGAVAGGVLGSIEEMLIHYKVYNKHYISTAATFTSITHLLKEKTGLFVSHWAKDRVRLNTILTTLKKIEQKIPYFLESITVAASLIKSLYETEEEYDITVLKLQKKTKEIYEKLGQEAEYFNILEKQMLVTSGFVIVEQFLLFKLVGCFQKNNEAFYGQLTNSQVWARFKMTSKEVLIALPGIMAMKQILINPVESYFNFKSQNLLYEMISNQWLVDEIPLKILQREDTEVLIDNLNKDIEAITVRGEGLRKSFFNDVIKSSYSQYLMYQYNAQDLIVLYQMYYSCTRYISEKLSKWQSSYNSMIRVLETKKTQL